MSSIVICIHAVNGLQTPSSLAANIAAGKIKVVDASTLDVQLQKKKCRLILPVDSAPEKSKEVMSFINRFVGAETLLVNTNSNPSIDKELIGDLQTSDGRSLTKELIQAGLATEKAAVLKGGVQRTAALSTLQSSTSLQQNLSNTAPLNGRLNETQLESLNGRTDKQSTEPMHGRVNDRQPDPLRGNVRSRAGNMLIIQSKKFELIPQPVRPHTPPFNRQLAPEPEPTRAPLRAVLQDSQQPQRTLGSSPPVRSETNNEAPQRQLALPPSRNSSEQPPQRAEYASGPPTRTISQLGRPERVLHAAERIPTAGMPTDTPPIRSAPQEYLASRLETSAVGSKRSSLPQAGTENKRREKRTAIAKVPDQNEIQKREQLESLLWDKWYSNLNELLCKELERSMNRHGNPAGSNQIQITVWNNHQVEVHLVQSSNNESFNNAVLEAYQALNGNRNLKFPPGSARDKVEFESNHIQQVSGPGTIDARSIQGDREFIQGK